MMDPIQHMMDGVHYMMDCWISHIAMWKKNSTNYFSCSLCPHSPSISALCLLSLSLLSLCFPTLLLCSLYSLPSILNSLPFLSLFQSYLGTFLFFIDKLRQKTSLVKCCLSLLNRAWPWRMSDLVFYFSQDFPSQRFSKFNSFKYKNKQDLTFFKVKLCSQEYK